MPVLSLITGTSTICIVLYCIINSSASGSRLSVSPEFWLSHFSTLYHSPRPICLPRSLTGPPDAFLDCAFSTTDVLRAVSRGANGKASGPDRLTNVCLKDALGMLLVPRTNLFNFCFSHGCCPPQWCHSLENIVTAVHCSRLITAPLYR